MNSVKCVQCLQKHLALAKSYAREVMDGHGAGGLPDHREDMDGELTNAELHAAVINQTMQLKIRALRRTMQHRRFAVEASDLEALSVLYHYADVFNGREVDPGVAEAYNALEAANVTSNVLSASVKSGCGCHKEGNSGTDKSEDVK